MSVDPHLANSRSPRVRFWTSQTTEATLQQRIVASQYALLLSLHPQACAAETYWHVITHLPALAGVLQHTGIHGLLSNDSYSGYAPQPARGWTPQRGTCCAQPESFGECDRVSGWRAKILPIIEEQDARDPFDIHVCGDCILARLAHLRLGGDDRSLPSTAAAERSTIDGGPTALAVAAGEPEQLPAPPVQLGSALAEHEQWQISRRAHPELIPLRTFPQRAC